MLRKSEARLKSGAKVVEKWEIYNKCGGKCVITIIQNKQIMPKIYLTTVLLLSLLTATVSASTIDSIRLALEKSSSTVVQEKAYVHMDNTCYFVGDTLWYKAYVVRADDLRQTDMSRLLYVELLNPDGLVVERQNVVISDKGLGDGRFVLDDSLYSGYYELRAYTRWMLNFNVTEHRYGREDRFSFYNNLMARDFFRKWDGLYSRVFPVYGKPDSIGDFSYKRMVPRPKQNVMKATADKLSATFYPEGGHLIEGIANRVAFELTDQEGQAVDVKGTVSADGMQPLTIKPTHLGRGVFTVTPQQGRLKAKFTWRGKDYSFNLPKAETSGVSLRLENGKATIAARNLPMGKEYGLSVLCRGVLKHFSAIDLGSGTATVELPDLPTGVNELTLFDSDGQILADRLFFVNNHDYDGYTIVVDSGLKTNYEPYEKITLGMKCDYINEPMLLSVAVRDTRTDEPTYNDGGIMTDLLLSSDLKGFVANPAYYFESSDAQHTADLDVLMMVQGWRKYKWKDLASVTGPQLRYSPETSMTVEGAVYKMLSVNEVEPDEIANWAYGKGYTGSKTEDEEQTDTEETTDDGFYSTEEISISDTETSDGLEYGGLNDSNSQLGTNHGGLKKEVLVEAEVFLGDAFAGSVQETHDGGRFLFEIPPFYGQTILNMKAYSREDSVKKNMMSREDKTALNEDAYPDYYVKRDLFYPRFAEKYSYYQNHAPETEYNLPIFEEDKSDLSMENDDHMLQNINVKGKRRGKRAIDYNKPAYVVDAYDIYNDLTDYGLSIGKFDARLFPLRVCQLLYGNMGRYITMNVDARMNEHTFYRNYELPEEEQYRVLKNYNPRDLYNDLKLKRLDKVRVFSDYEPRNEDAPMVSDRINADATIDLVTISDNGAQPTSRDRRIRLNGINEPIDFYSPDYSVQKPQEPTDYRRTLYWNPNMLTDSEGRLKFTFFNNSKETRIKVSAVGITADGKLVE